MIAARRLILAACLASGLAPGLARADSAAAAPIAALDTGLAAAEKNAATPFADRYAAMAPAVDRAFNLPQLLQSTVGLRWAQIAPAQREKLLAAFRAFTIASYVANFNTDSGDGFRILPETRNIGADQVVETEIVPKSGDPTRIDYVMRQGQAGWQVVDVLEQGTISQVAVQRSDFRSLLSDGTGVALTDSLNNRVAKLSGGAIHP
jgi:phospholipid transport system substrate-binding protein